MSDRATLVLRLAAPLQAWGTSSRHNYRTTGIHPSKAGIIGLLAAAQGLDRGADLSLLNDLTLAVRVDQPGRIMMDFHTVSSLDGSPLPAAKVNAKGLQSRTSPNKFTYVTRRQYIEDAVFVAMVEGDSRFVTTLADAVCNPRYPLSLGRRSCVPSEPLVVHSPSSAVWHAAAEELIGEIPWQKGRASENDKSIGSEVTLTATIDDLEGEDVVADVPVSFDPRRRGFQTRRVRHLWVTLPTGKESHGDQSRKHNPFSLLGGVL